MSHRSLDQVNLKDMPFSLWYSRSDPAVLEASREWRGSLCDPLETGVLTKRIRISVSCFHQFEISMLPELLIKARTWRVRSAFSETFFICLNEFSEVLGALHRLLAAGGPYSSTDLQRAQLTISKGFCSIHFLIWKISVTCQNFSEVYTQFLSPETGIIYI